MYLPKLTAAIPLAAILYFATPDPSFISRAFAVLGLRSHTIEYNILFLACAVALSCLVDEAYRYGPNEVKKRMVLWYYDLGSDESESRPDTGSSTSSVSTSTLANALGSSRIGRAGQ